MTEYSASPAGDKFAIPEKSDYAAEFERLQQLVDAARGEGKRLLW